jgi:hypothetical protein
MSAADPKCSTCAYRVFECTNRTSYETTMTMFCLHPQGGKQSCASVRLPADAKCGPDAVLWKSRLKEVLKAYSEALVTEAIANGDLIQAADGVVRVNPEALRPMGPPVTFELLAARQGSAA